MMQKLVAFAAGILLLASPALVAADTLGDLQAQLGHLLAQIATLEAQQEMADTGAPITCALVTSKNTVRVGEPFLLAWGSQGALDIGEDPTQSVWPPNGVSTIKMQEQGRRKYTFKFYGHGGISTTCSVTFTVLPASK
jgi:hypothetical protein